MRDAERIARQAAMPRAVALWRALMPLRSVVRFMNSGAHPDDEMTVMLAPLALRDGLRVSIACSTRGEGGQNALGPETGRDLGVIRTREMERSAAVLGMPLYWLSEGPEDPIWDFGFSKSGVETLGKWGKERLLRRFVRAIRLERPDILCPTFLDVPGQHGHHRAMTEAAHLAIGMAADAGYRDGLEPWQVAKLYLPAWSGAGNSYDDDEPPPPATVMVDGSGEETVSGADWAQIGQASRAFHATQGMGHWVPPGRENRRPLHLAWAVSGNLGPEEAVTDGLPRTLAGIGLGTAQAACDAAIAAWPDYSAVAGHAARALAALADVKGHEHRVAAKRRELARVLGLARGVRARLAVEPAFVRPGGSDRVDARLRAAGLGVETLGPEALASADFGQFAAVLVGIFAARANPGLARRVADLHGYVRGGGVLVTLYHRPWDDWDILPLAPLKVGKPSLRWRVTDENAAVTVLEPEAAVFHAPNEIGPADWAGWQKERGLYFAAEWDAAYRPLVALADPGEAPHRGALLEGRFGAGLHRHCALILHHQLDELVGGAYRLMGNLLARPEG